MMFPNFNSVRTSLFRWGLFFVVLSTYQCKQLQLGQEDFVLARVGNVYLYASDLPELPQGQKSTQDSILWARDYINRWGRQQLLYQQARVNLSDEQQLSLENTIQDYRTELFANTYKDELLKQEVRKPVTDSSLRVYYDQNKTNFRLQSPLIQFRSIRLMQTHPDFDQIRSHFISYLPSDQKYLDSLHYQFDYSQLNDSVWFEFSPRVVEDSLVYDQLREQLSKKSQFFEFKDSVHVSLNYILQHKSIGEFAPFLYLKPTIENIRNNQQRVRQQKAFELQFIQDALKNKTFEIYE